MSRASGGTTYQARNRLSNGMHVDPILVCSIPIVSCPGTRFLVRVREYLERWWTPNNMNQATHNNIHWPWLDCIVHIQTYLVFLFD
jgi:hypothetical protein